MKNKIKLVLSIALIIASFVTIFKSFIGGVLILLAGLVIYPKISDKLLKTIPIWKNRAVRIIVPILLFIFGASTNAIQNKDNITLGKKESAVIEYIKQNVDNDKSLTNLKILSETGSLFDNGNSFLQHPHDGYLKPTTDTLTGISTFIANPRLNFEKIESLRYLKPDPKKGNIIGYTIKYDVDKSNQIIANKTIIEYSETGSEEFTNETIPSLADLINQDAVSYQKDLIAMEQQAKKDKEEYDKRAKKFEDDCLNPWDGSHILLVRLIKEQANDPSSFEHVTTTYRLFKGFAVINMTFRGKNAFNATITNKISAKVSLEDCSIIEIIE